MMALENLTPLRDPRPLYLQIEDALIQLLADSEPGEQLPPEPELAHRLGVSRSTLREALRALKDKGLIARKHGVGTFVQPRPSLILSGLETLESLDVIAGRLGMAVHTAQVTIEERSADEQPGLGEKLDLPPDDKLVCVCRVKLADEQPVAYIEDMVPATVATVDELRAGFRDSVLDYLLQRGDPQPDHARADIRALPANREMAAKLEQQPGAALLLLEEILYSTEGKPIDYSRNYFVPGYFNFHVIRRISGF
jgi:GntR family transcriptional regulator